MRRVSVLVSNPDASDAKLQLKTTCQGLCAEQLLAAGYCEIIPIACSQVSTS
jgi:hypothetical protein